MAKPLYGEWKRDQFERAVPPVNRDMCKGCCYKDGWPQGGFERRIFAGMAGDRAQEGQQQATPDARADAARLSAFSGGLARALAVTSFAGAALTAVGCCGQRR